MRNDTDATDGGDGPARKLILARGGTCVGADAATRVNRGKADGSDRRSANRCESLAARRGDEGAAALGLGGDGTGRTTGTACAADEEDDCVEVGCGETTLTRDADSEGEAARKLTKCTEPAAGESSRGVGGVPEEERSRNAGNCAPPIGRMSP